MNFFKININLKLIQKFIKNARYIIENVNKLNLEKCFLTNGKENWEQVTLKNNEDKLDFNSTHVSMYGFESSFYIDYKGYDKYEYKEYLYVSSSENHLLTIKFNTKFLVFGTTINYQITDDSYYYYNNVKNIGIIGYIGKTNDLWYPAFYKYDDRFNRLYENIKNRKDLVYKNILKEIVNAYEYDVENSIIIGTYSILAYKIAKLGFD